MPFGSRINKRLNKKKRLSRKNAPLKWKLDVLEETSNFRPYYLYRGNYCNMCHEDDPDCYACHEGQGYPEYNPSHLDPQMCSSGTCGIPLPRPPPHPHPHPHHHPVASGCPGGSCGLQRPHPQPHPHPPPHPVAHGCPGGSCGVPSGLPRPTKRGCCGGPGSTPEKCGYYLPMSEPYGTNNCQGITNSYNAYNINMSSNISQANNNLHSYLDKYM